MRVGVFYPTLNVYGGAEFVTVAMLNALVEKGYDVILFCDSEVKQAEIERYFGVKIKTPAKVIVKTTMVKPRGLLDFYRTILQSYIFKRKCDIWIDVYTNRVFPWTNICYMHFPFFNHERFTPHFPYLKYGQPSLITRVPSVFFETKFHNGKKQLLLANSQYTADEIAHFLNKRAIVLYPPVPATIFHEKIENHRENLVVIISRFERAKSLEKILDIAALAPEKVKVAVIGRVHDQATFNKLQASIRKCGLNRKLKLHPNVSRMQLNAMLQKAKVYLHLKEGEHFGISIVEGMAMGCLPIVHNSGGPREFVPKQWLYNSNQEAIKKITEALENWSPDKAREVRRIAETFRYENFAKSFTEIFENFLN